ncbi:MAG: alpha/beta hydrolase family protein [Anaerolineae bacterium]
MADEMAAMNLGALATADIAALPQWLLYGGEASPLYRLMARQTLVRLQQRADEVAGLKTAAHWRQRQQAVRRRLDRIVGPFPERTPLNATVTGVVQKRGYRIEKLVFESLPRYYVTGCVFVPDGLAGRAPAILNPIGHTDIAFRGRLYQQLILNLVAKGFVVLAYDPAGQGERLQYFDPETGGSRIGWSVREHFYAGDQCFLAGSSLARYVTWDGMRAIDYLQSRDDVDPARIGVTGISRGGTRTAYIAACDERVAAASPCCYITGFRRLLESIGPQDAEQVLAGSVAAGIDHADLLEVMAPKPVLIAAATRDFFSIQGARETYAEARRAYEALGAPANLEMVEGDLEHGYRRVIREATYGFFQRSLGLPGDASEVEVDYLTMEELTVTPTGQLATSLGGETVFSRNRAEAARLPAAKGDAREAAARLSGYREPEAVESVFIGRHNHEGFALEQYQVAGEGDYRLPLTVAVPNEGDGRVALFIHAFGRKNGLNLGLTAWLLGRGIAVALADVGGIGELAGPRGWPAYREAYTALLMGRSVVGVQAGDIVRLVCALTQRSGARRGELVAVADREMCPAMLHAAAFEPTIARVALVRPLVSYRSVVDSRYYLVGSPAMVPGALTAYDLPDLMASLAPRPLLLANAVDPNEHILPEVVVRQQLAAVTAAYGGKGLQIRQWAEDQPCSEVFGEWLA